MPKDRVRANDTAHPVTRRTVLASLPMAGLAPAAMAADGDAELLRHYREYLDAIAACDGLAEADKEQSPEMKQHHFCKVSALDAMTALVPSTIAGIAAVAHVLWLEHGPVYLPGTEMHVIEMARPEYRLMRSLLEGAHQMTAKA